MSSQIRWAILGTSHISEVMAKAIHESKLGQLIAVGGRTIEKAQAFAQPYSVPTYYGDYDAVLADPNVDVVYIGLPNHLHKEWVIRCAQAGKHILCEKPFATNLQDAQEALAAVKKANVFCMEALMYRCHPLTSKLCQLIKDKVIGDVKFFNATYVAEIADVANPIDGGAILNLGCYPVSLVRLLAGIAHNKQVAEPSDVVSVGEMDMAKDNVRRASMLMHFPKQMIATISTADDIKMQSQFDIYGTEGHLQVQSNPWMPGETSQILIKHNNEADSQEIIVAADKSLYAYQIDFVSQHIIDGKIDADTGGVTWLDTLGNVIVLDAWNKQVQAKAGKNGTSH